MPGNENSNNNKVYDEHLEEESLQQESHLQTERNSESYSKTKATLEWREWESCCEEVSFWNESHTKEEKTASAKEKECSARVVREKEFPALQSHMRHNKIKLK